MDYIAKMSIYANIIAYENEVFTDVANESTGGASNPIKTFIKFLLGIIEKIGRSISRVVNLIKMGISKLKKGNENKDAMHQQIKTFISKSNETSELIEKGSMIISYAIKSIDKDKLTDNDLDNLIEINAELVELRADIDENLNEMEKNMPSGSLFSTDGNRSQLESLLAAMTSILDKVINMKSQLTEIENRLKGQNDETEFRRIAIILRLRNNITSYSLAVMQFNNMLMQAAH